MVSSCPIFSLQANLWHSVSNSSISAFTRSYPDINIPEKPYSDPGLFLQSLGCEFVQTGGFLLGVFKGYGLDKTLVHQCLEASVDFAQGRPGFFIG